MEKFSPLLGLGLVLLSGCATPLNEQLTHLQKATVCCKHYNEINYEKLNLPDAKKVEFKPESPAFNFESGKSFFAAYQLPPFSGPYNVTLHAYPSAGMGDSTTLRPKILLLDEAFNVTRQIDESNAHIRNSAGKVVMDFFVNKSDRKDYYIILHTIPNRENSGITSKVYSPVIIPIGTVVVPIDGKESSRTTYYSPMGILELRLSPYKPNVVGQEPY